MTRHVKIILVLFAVAILVFLGVKKTTYDNEDFLISMAEGFDVPSKPYYFLIERIYKIAESRDIATEIGQNLRSGNKEHLHNLYLRILGVIGRPPSPDFLLDQYARYGNDPDRVSRSRYLIETMGLSGDAAYTVFLKSLLDRTDQKNIDTRYLIARSLYLITGEKYRVNGEEFHISPELEEARKVIVASKNRKRTFQEMLVLDKILRPPDRQE